MIPREPTRRLQLGFLYIPPYRVQGISVAGEQTVVHIPELDICFDIGKAPRSVLSANYVVLSHGHMDHAAGIAYYFSQRQFQGMGVGTLVCHPALEQPIRDVMNAWVKLEGQRTPHNVVPLEHNGELEIKNHIYLRGFETVHTVASMGFVVVERRSKLKPEFIDLPQEKLLEIKNRGEQITQTIEIPLICYTGDTYGGEHFDRDDVLNAQILITECTFLEKEHRERASVGKHLHIDDILQLLERSKAKALVLTHLSRRTHMGLARRRVAEVVPPQHRDRVYLLMDNRTNRARYERQVSEAESKTVQ